MQNWGTSQNSTSPGDNTQNPVHCSLPFLNIRNGGKAKRIFKKSKNLNTNTKIVLLYTGLFFHPWWWKNHEEDLHRYTYEKKCKIKNCYFTYDKNAFGVADAVVFHGVDINKPQCLRRLSNMRPKQQKWILFMHESPIYTINLEPYNGLFNWTMTYMQKSETYVPYFTYEKLKWSSNGLKKAKNFAEGKTGRVAWVVRHCGLLRDEYALELSKYIDVHVYGTCGSKFKNNMGRCSDWGTQCEDEIKQYKFYLAFENCFCEDYVTEKYWDKGLKYGLIPVTMGAIDKRTKVIPGSYIDVNDFDSIENLAKHLRYLDSNDTAYNEYFKWRFEYKVTNGVDSFCEICQTLHDPAMKDNVYNDLKDFWSVEKICDKYGWKVKEIKSQISKSKFKFRDS